MNRLYVIGAVAVLALGSAYFAFNSNSAPSPGASLGAAEAQATDGDVDTSGIVEMFEGSADAPVTVVEYASFTCPHCKSFHEQTYGGVKENYVDTGKVKFVFREVYFDQFGLWAGMIARCGGPEKYFGIVDILFKEQSEWLASRDPQTIAAELRKIGIRAGINGEDVDACMRDGEKAQALVALFQKNSEADSIRSTPSFIIEGDSYTNMSLADFSEVLDGKLGE